MASPIATEYPGTAAELVATVRQATATGRRIKAIGRGHSLDGMASTDGVSIRLDNYRRLLHVDRAGGRVTVQAGITLHDLSRFLSGWGVELPDIGGMPGQTVGGAMATGSHGHGARCSGLSSWVVGLDLLLADGSLVSCSAREEPEIFDAARVSLGALGVVSTVTLRCVPGFNLRSVTTTMRFEALLERFDECVDTGDHIEMLWIPGAGRVAVRTRSRTDEPPGRVRRGHVDRGYRVHPGPRRPAGPVIEYSVPRRDAVPVIRRVRDHLAGCRWALPFPIRLGVAAADNLPMSPAGGRSSVFIGVGAGLSGIEALLDEAGGRPQWGSLHRQTAATLRSRYPRWDAWQAVRRRLDPDGWFANGWTDRVLGQTSGQG